MIGKGRYLVSPGDIDIFTRAADPTDGIGGNWFLGYYFERQFMPWQYIFHHASQEDITVIGGTGSGKTVGAGLSYATWAATTPRFKFMNLAPTSYQSKLMFDAILREADGKPFERFITKVVERPYPKIVLSSDYIGESTLEFFSAHDDASKIQGWEGDCMNLDESGLIPNGNQLIGMMVTRLRGTVPMPGGGVRGRLRRISMITASYSEAPPWLWNRMDMMAEDPKNFLSMTVTSANAGTLSDSDIESYKRRIPVDQQALLLEGARPTGAGDHFSLDQVVDCEDLGDNRNMQYHTMEKDTPSKGWIYTEVPGIGCTHFEMPPDNRMYLLIGDPGMGNPPLRNAGVVTVWDITNFPKEPARLRYFNWVFGRGSYTNFLNAYEYAYNTYRPMEAIIDSTGPQTLWNEQVLLDRNIWASGFDFSGKKQGMLVSAMQLVNRGIIRFPFIQGLRSQLVNYSLQRDSKLSQDIVVNVMMLAYYLRDALWDDHNEHEVKGPDAQFESARNVRNPRDIQHTR